MTWRVLLVGGASGTGKSSLAYPLARSRGAVLVEVDDLVVAAQAITTRDSHPALHHWPQHDDADLTADEVLAHQIAVARALRPAVDAVIANHLDTDLPPVLGGDYLLPEQVPHDVRVRAVVVHEPDPERVLRNYALREPDRGEQRRRADLSVHYGEWLVAEAGRHGVPVLEPRPWADAPRRRAALL